MKISYSLLVSALLFPSIRAGWVFGVSMTPDLALARLDRALTFSEFVSPICIPEAEDISDVPKLSKESILGLVDIGTNRCDGTEFHF